VTSLRHNRQQLPLARLKKRLAHVHAAIVNFCWFHLKKKFYAVVQVKIAAREAREAFEKESSFLKQQMVCKSRKYQITPHIYLTINAAETKRGRLQGNGQRTQVEESTIDDRT
jgi:hypothetical protein